VQRDPRRQHPGEDRESDGADDRAAKCYANVISVFGVIFSLELYVVGQTSEERS
jgi:hypothetical protein